MAKKKTLPSGFRRKPKNAFNTLAREIALDLRFPEMHFDLVELENDAGKTLAQRFRKHLSWSLVGLFQAK